MDAEILKPWVRRGYFQNSLNPVTQFMGKMPYHLYLLITHQKRQQVHTLCYLSSC